MDGWEVATCTSLLYKNTWCKWNLLCKQDLHRKCSVYVMFNLFELAGYFSCYLCLTSGRFPLSRYSDVPNCHSCPLLVSGSGFSCWKGQCCERCTWRWSVLDEQVCKAGASWHHSENVVFCTTRKLEMTLFFFFFVSLLHRSNLKLLDYYIWECLFRGF